MDHLELLRDCRTALGDWIATYASEFCNDKNVQAAHSRIAEGGGTLAYVGKLVSRINDELERAADSAEAGTKGTGGSHAVE